MTVNQKLDMLEERIKSYFKANNNLLTLVRDIKIDVEKLQDDFNYAVTELMKHKDL